MLRAEAEALALGLMRHFGLADYVFRWNKSVTRCGRHWFPCFDGPGRIELSIHYVEYNEAALVENTIRHEIAHAIAFAVHGERGHGPAWEAACRVAGARPERLNRYAMMPPGQWVAACPGCGRRFRRYRRPRPGYLIWCPSCGQGSGLLLFARAG